MSVYMGYLDEYERALLIEEATIENEISKLNTLYEMVCLKEEQELRDIELKVFSESGTYDDYAYLVEEAEVTNLNEKKNIITRIFEAIGRFFSKLLGLNKQIAKIDVPPEEEIEVPSDIEQRVSAVDKIMMTIASIPAKLFTDPSGLLKDIKAALITAGVLAVGGKVLYSKIKKSRADQINTEMEEHEHKVVNIANTVNSASNSNNSNSNSGFLSQCVEKCKELLNKLKDGISFILNSIKNGLAKVGNVITGKNKKNEEYQNRADENKKKSIELAQHGNVLDKTVGDMRYRIDRTTGEVIECFDSTGKSVIFSKNHLPPQIIKVQQSLKGRAAAKNQEIKKENEIQNKINSNLKSKTFAPAETGVRVSINGQNTNVSINNKLINIDPKLSDKKIKKLLMNNGVTSNADDVVKAYRASLDGVKNANDAVREENIRNAVTDRQNRTENDERFRTVYPQQPKRKRGFWGRGKNVTESVCETINKALYGTTLEAYVNEEENCIILREYTVDPVSFNDNEIEYLENAGYTIVESSEFYTIY